MTAGKRILESQGYVDAVTSQDLKVRTKGLSTAKLSLLDTTDLVCALFRSRLIVLEMRDLRRSWGAQYRLNLNFETVSYVAFSARSLVDIFASNHMAVDIIIRCRMFPKFEEKHDYACPERVMFSINV